MVKKNEIRIGDPSKIVWDTVNKLATNGKRTIGKQTEYMLEKAIKAGLFQKEM